MQKRRSISGSRFYGKPLRQPMHRTWRLNSALQERVRGAIRGAAARESLLHPSPSKSAQRRIRKRLVAAYIRRFGTDAFVIRFCAERFPAGKAGNWLPSGYAWWRERALGRVPQRGAWPTEPKEAE